ncbi:hypothetical protein [Microcoleus sp. Aus8_D2]
MILFGNCIIYCSITHIMEIRKLWHPNH